MLKHGILGLLNYGSMTGYDITRTFRDSLSYFWNVQTSQIYRELKTLKANGWAMDETVVQTGKPDKNVFSITESGRTELNRWLTADNTEFLTRFPLLMKTFFRGERSVSENIAYFDGLREKCLRFAEEMRTTPPDIEGYAAAVGDPEKAIYWQMTLEFGMMYTQMLLKWTEACKQRLEEAADEHSAD
jgi:DNA-binding PadR family transcriptional regulator